MKKSIMAGLAVVTVSAFPLLAQRPFGVLTSPPDPATIVQNRVARLTKLLGLSSSQAAQATTLFTNAQTGLAPFQTSLTQARQALPAAVKNNDGATIDQLAQNIGSATTQITSIQNKADAAFYAILNPSQQSTLSQSEGRGMGGPHMRGMGRHP